MAIFLSFGKTSLFISKTLIFSQNFFIYWLNLHILAKPLFFSLHFYLLAKPFFFLTNILSIVKTYFIHG
jgi:hypothetical protein